MRINQYLRIILKQSQNCLAVGLRLNRYVYWKQVLELLRILNNHKLFIWVINNLFFLSSWRYYLRNSLMNSKYKSRHKRKWVNSPLEYNIAYTFYTIIVLGALSSNKYITSRDSKLLYLIVYKFLNKINYNKFYLK